MRDKLLNFLIIFLLVYLTISLFQNKNIENKLSNTIILKTNESYTIPALVKIEIKNETQKQFTFNTCNNFSIKKDSNIINTTDCKDINIPSWSWYIIDFSKNYSLFKETWKYYANLKKDNIDIISQFNIENRSFIWKFFIFFFYAPIYNLVVFLLEITNYSLWWTIIIVTIIIRLILLIPQHKIMVSQIKMQKIQPKIKEIQEKHKWNHQMLWMELMKLYRDEKVNPMWSCWLLLIQMPILIVIYQVIISIKDISNTYYLYSFLWDYKISNIDTNFFSIDLFWIGWINWFILAIIVWFLQYLQVKLSLIYSNQNNKNNWIVLEKKKNSNNYSDFMPDPELLNKFMLYWMPIMVAIITYTFFAWVWIYWWVWTIFIIFQQLFVNKILKK